MRVSPTFNWIAAQLLYRSITIDDSTKWRFASFPELPKGMERLTKDKLFNVKYVDQVRFEYAHESDCVSNLLPGSHALNVSISTYSRSAIGMDCQKTQEVGVLVPTTETPQRSYTKVVRSINTSLTLCPPDRQ